MNNQTQNQPIHDHNANIKELFGDITVNIITLRQHLEEKAVLRAFELGIKPEKVEEYSKVLLKTEFTELPKEFVDIHADYVIIGINADVIDERATNRAIRLLSSMDDIHTIRRVEFNE